MRNNFFVILGGQSLPRRSKAEGPVLREQGVADLDLLKSSPCLSCDLFVEDTACPYVGGCSKIDQFQRLAAAHCTLCKFQDIRALVKI